MARLGLPLTVAGGMHQLDCNSHVHNKVSESSPDYVYLSLNQSSSLEFLYHP